MNAPLSTRTRREIEANYSAARRRYADRGVHVESALRLLKRIPVSLQCWQGDDVAGFETSRAALGGGLAVTGNYLGKARTGDELRADLDEALRHIPGTHRVNLHASYAETGNRTIERTDLEPRHFSRWIDWAADRNLGIDFNPTYFSHAKAADGFTLSHRDRSIREFWIAHGIACRKIGAAIGRKLGQGCITNFWIPDGFKDTPIDRFAPRERLANSLDAIFSVPVPARWNLDAVESKLFGLGSESYVVGSHEFYLGYAIQRRKLLCLDAGHFHPTESIADKISAVLGSVEAILLHVSRGVRWDSDHVVTLTNDLEAIAQEIIRSEELDRIHIGLDFFDASINRIAAWVIGTRCMIKALLLALLEPTRELRRLENAGDFTSRLALLEEQRTMPFGAVWDYYCLQSGVAPREAWLGEVQRYEREVLARR